MGSLFLLKKEKLSTLLLYQEYRNNSFIINGWRTRTASMDTESLQPLAIHTRRFDASLSLYQLIQRPNEDHSMRGDNDRLRQ